MTSFWFYILYSLNTLLFSPMPSIILPSRDDIFIAFREQWYIEMDSPIRASEAFQCVTRFREAIARITPEVLTQTYGMFDRAQDIDVGFVDRSVKDNHDEKYYFHYHPFLESQRHFPDSVEYTRFLASLREVYREMDSVVRDIFDILAGEDEQIHSYLYVDPASRTTNSNTRILQYRPKSHMEYLAKPHEDRGFLTLALYETDPGLRMHTPDGRIIRSDYQEWRMKLFPGDLYHRVIWAKSPLPGTTHDVINLMESNKRRASIVHFTNLARAIV